MPDNDSCLGPVLCAALILGLGVGCDTNGRFGSGGSYYPSSGGGSSTYRTHSTCWGAECTIEIQEVGGSSFRQRQAEGAHACNLNSDCRRGMSCLAGTCSPECKADRDCEEGQLCMPAAHGYGECEVSEPRVKLTEAIALRAMAPAIAAAQACFSDEDRASRAEVRVHLLVEGFGGRLEEVTLPGSWEAKPLGQCVAKHMSSVRFPALTQPHVAFWYPVQAGVVPEVEARPTSSPSTAAASEAAAESSEGKLDSGQIKAGLAPRQDEIDACFERSAAVPDARVAVRVSVEGSSGWVAAVEVVDETADTPLATCVAAAIAGATFETFPASTQSFTFKARRAEKI